MKKYLPILLLLAAAFASGQSISEVKVGTEKTPGVITAGTVTSVDCTSAQASLLTCGGGPITTTGTFTISWPTQSANRFFAGPPSGAAAVPTARAWHQNDWTGSAPAAYDVAAISSGGLPEMQQRPRRLCQKKTSSVTQTTTETALIVCALPAGLGANADVKIQGLGIYDQDNATPGTLTVRMYLGGASGGCTAGSTCTGGPAGSTEVYDSGGDANLADQVADVRPMWFEVSLSALGSTTSQQCAALIGVGALSAGAATGSGDFASTQGFSAPRTLNCIVSSIDTATATDLVLTWTMSTTTQDVTVTTFDGFLYP